MNRSSARNGPASQHSPHSPAMTVVMISRLSALAAVSLLAVGSATAQAPTPPASLPSSSVAAPPSPPPALSVSPRSFPTGIEAGRSSIYLSAIYVAGDTQPVLGGLKWRVFREGAEPDGSHQLAAESNEAAPLLILPDGAYVVHVAFGLAGATRRVELRGQSASERIVLNAGALRILPMLGETPVPPQRVAISIYVPDRTNPEGRLVASNMRPGDLICLPEGTYHIVSTLSEPGTGTASGTTLPTNSVVTADLRVQAAKVIEGTLRHRAAQITLKLVNNAGGEALANTAFTVLTPGGDVIRELIGAFPSLVLAEGEYVTIARHDGKTYQSVFQVQSALDREVEIKTK